MYEASGGYEEEPKKDKKVNEKNKTKKALIIGGLALGMALGIPTAMKLVKQPNVIVDLDDLRPGQKEQYYEFAPGFFNDHKEEKDRARTRELFKKAKTLVIVDSVSGESKLLEQLEIVEEWVVNKKTSLNAGFYKFWNFDESEIGFVLQILEQAKDKETHYDFYPDFDRGDRLSREDLASFQFQLLHETDKFSNYIKNTVKFDGDLIIFDIQALRFYSRHYNTMMNPEEEVFYLPKPLNSTKSTTIIVPDVKEGGNKVEKPDKNNEPSIPVSSDYYDFAPGYKNDYYYTTDHFLSQSDYVNKVRAFAKFLVIVDSKNGFSEIIHEHEFDQNDDIIDSLIKVSQTMNNDRKDIELMLVDRTSNGEDEIIFSTYDDVLRKGEYIEDIYEHSIDNFNLLMDLVFFNDDLELSYFSKTSKYQDEKIIFDVQALRFYAKYLNSVKNGDNKPFELPTAEHQKAVEKVKTK